MVRLLDVNVLIALCDPSHQFHRPAWAWFKPVSVQGWATCPLTENGLLRILGHPSYPQGPGSPSVVREMLGYLCRYEKHVFWADDVTFNDPKLFPALEGLSSSHLTDAYLMGLAVHHHGKLATFDAGISDRLTGGRNVTEQIPVS